MKHESALLALFPSLKHGFFPGYPAGFSKGKQVLTTWGGPPLPVATLKQIHGTHVWTITGEAGEVGEGDGLVTRQKNRALGIFTADCGPILFYEPQAEVIGACHAGWRGARAGIIQETLKAMEELGATRSQIHTALGPTIQQCHYEVGSEFPDEIGETYETYFIPSPKEGHHYFNLPLYIQKILLDQGIVRFSDLQVSTFNTSFLSRRRSRSEGHVGFRDNLSVIAMT